MPKKCATCDDLVNVTGENYTIYYFPPQVRREFGLESLTIAVSDILTWAIDEMENDQKADWAAELLAIRNCYYPPAEEMA